MKALHRFPLLLAGAAALAMAASASAQDTPRATDYQEVLKLPDWSGIWYPDWGALFGGRAAVPQLTPAAQAVYDKYLADTKENGPNQAAQAQCLPPGLPGVMQQPYPIEILYSPGRVTILTEAYTQVRRIYTDGRKNPEEPDLFFIGNSVGHWEGDVLVVETVGLHPSTYIAPGIGHGEKMKIVERIWLEKPGQLMDEMTITDPDTLTQPFVTRVAYKLDNSYPIREYVCAENNHLISGENGANINLPGIDPNDTPVSDDPFADE